MSAHGGPVLTASLSPVGASAGSARGRQASRLPGSTSALNANGSQVRRQIGRGQDTPMARQRSPRQPASDAEMIVPLLAELLGPSEGPARQQLARGLRELGVVDRAVY